MLFKLFAWVLPGGPILSAIATAAGAVFRFLAWLLASFLEGLTRMMANPITFVTAGCLMLACLAGGVRLGVKWDAHLVKVAKERLESRTKERDAALLEITQWKGRLDEQKDRAVTAELAREQAERDAATRIADAELAKEKAAAEARAARGALAKRLRDPAAGAKAGPKETAGPGLFGLEALFGKGG